MKRPCQLSGHVLDAICGIVVLFFWKPFHPVSRKDRVLCSSSVSFPSVTAKHKVHRGLYLAKVFAWKKGGGNGIQPKLCRGMSSWLNNIHIFKVWTVSCLELFCLKAFRIHLKDRWDVHLALPADMTFLFSIIFWFNIILILFHHLFPNHNY